MNSSTDDDNDLAVQKPRRFYFDHLDLDEGAAERAAAEEAARKAAEEAARNPPPPTFSEEELEQARKTAYAQGLQEGKQKALEGINEAARRALEHIGAQMTQLLETETHRLESQQSQAVQLGIAIIRKLMPGLAADHGLSEVEHAIRNVLVNHMEEQRLVIRAPSALMDALKNRIDALGENMGYAGKLILLADDGLGPSDCRVEWADGGAERDMDALYERIERAARRALSGVAEMENEAADTQQDKAPAGEASAKEKDTDEHDEQNQPTPNSGDDR